MTNEADDPEVLHFRTPFDKPAPTMTRDISLENELMLVLSSLRESDARSLAKQAGASVEETQTVLERLVGRGDVLRFDGAAAPVYRNAPAKEGGEA